MSLTIPQPSQQGLFKQGYNSYDAEDGAVIRNVSYVFEDPAGSETDNKRSMHAGQSRRLCKPP
jgi:hypothetical protein